MTAPYLLTAVPTLEHTMTRTDTPRPKRGSTVTYKHPDWGHCRGRVLDPGPVPYYASQSGPPVPSVLVQDLSPNGAREWWPLADIQPAGPR